MRYQIVDGDQRLGSYSPWDIIRLFDEGQITEDTMLVLGHLPSAKPSPLAEKDLFKWKDDLRALSGPHGQVVMVDLLSKIRGSLFGLCIGIGLWMLVYVIFGFIPTLTK